MFYTDNYTIQTAIESHFSLMSLIKPSKSEKYRELEAKFLRIADLCNSSYSEFKFNEDLFALTADERPHFDVIWKSYRNVRSFLVERS